MIIANPIYDVVFKYLLEDIEIARELLSTILGEEVISLDLKPQETATERSGSSVSILRFDFKAVIKTQTGELKKVLIELQKAKQVFDAMRFRRYLGDNYRKEDTILNESGELVKVPLPIVTIYFLGFPLDNIKKNAVVKISREYQDVVTHEILELKEDFVELLTHDSYLIQLRLLAGKSRTKLEKVLQVFSPEFGTEEDKQQLDFTGDLDEPLVKKMVARLGRAIASEEMRNKMDVEDEIDRIFERELGKKDKIIAAKDYELEIKDKELVLKDQKLVGKEQELAAQAQELAAQVQELATQAQLLESEKQKTAAFLQELEELRKRVKE